MRPTRRQVLGWAAVGSAAAVVPGMSGCGLTSAVGSSTGAPPSPSSTAQATDAEVLASLALWTAYQGEQGGSYGIGGVLVDNATGTVLQTMPNRVFRTLPAGKGTSASAGPPSTFVQDPTAHGERQLASWYLAQRAARGLPAADQLTVVTSLDPCLMCTGAILTAGFNAGVVALDDFSGVNYSGKGDFLDLPEPLRARALSTFGYYGVDGGRGFQGSEAIASSGTLVDQDTYQECSDIYAQSSDKVRAARGTASVPPSRLTNPATDPESVNIRRAFEVVYPGAFGLSVPDGRRPTRAVYDALVGLVSSTSGSTNAVGFLDPFGNLVVAAADQPAVSPLNTAFAECTRAYAQTRYALMEHPITAPVAARTLTNPGYGTFVFLRAPDPFTPEGIFDYGAYGSTLAAPASPFIPSAFQYYELPPGVTERDLQDVVPPLPPLYSQHLAMMPQRVVDSA
ncbi:MAG: nucleoside deaminase [bacterium]